MCMGYFIWCWDLCTEDEQKWINFCANYISSAGRYDEKLVCPPMTCLPQPKLHQSNWSTRRSWNWPNVCWSSRTLSWRSMRISICIPYVIISTSSPLPSLSSTSIATALRKTKKQVYDMSLAVLLNSRGFFHKGLLTFREGSWHGHQYL